VNGEQWDAVIVGAGPSGTLVAETLQAKGLDVLLLEGGPRWLQRPESPPEDDATWGFQAEVRRFDWHRVRALGGASLVWGGWMDRFPEVVFRDGAWPYGLAELAPYYEAIEKQLGVVEERLEARYHRLGKTLGLDVKPKRVAMAGSGIWTAHQLQASKQAECHSVALRVEHDGQRTRAIEVVAPSGDRIQIRARAFVLAASPVESTRILLMSELGSLSPRIGRGLLNHSMVGYALLEPHFRRSAARSDPCPGSAFIPRFVNLGEERRRPYRGGFSIEIDGPRPLESLDPDLREQLGAPEADAEIGVTFIHGMGETEPHPGRFVDLSPDLADALDRPVPRIHLPSSELEVQLVEDMRTTCTSVTDALAGPGSDLVHYADALEAPMLFHEAGTCAMGPEPDAVCDSWGRMRALENLWIADASAMPSAGDRHPTLTILAHALRAAQSVAATLH
jgi:paromamine 6'-oxidase/6'''-hydroxyneomycin C oxidase/2'-deamino-2'-hydroxyparomamine 6'-oxidase